MLGFIYADMKGGSRLYSHWCQFSLHSSVKLSVMIRILEVDYLFIGSSYVNAHFL